MFFPIIGNILEQNSQKYFQIIHAEHTCQASGPNLPTVEQLELLGALVEVVTHGDAVAPALIITFLQAVAPKTAQVSRAEKMHFPYPF